MDRWYLGVYGFEASDFTARVDTSVFSNQNCANSCSTHGSCASGRCSCNQNFRGDSCEYDDTPLTSDVVHGYVDQGEWNFFVATSNTVNSIEIVVAQNEGGDCDLYVKESDYPNRTSFDYADLGFQSPHITITDPGQKTWHIGVFGWRPCDFNVSFIEQQNNCVNGQMENDECICNPGYYGDDCSVQPTPVSLTQTLGGSVRYAEWSYYVLVANSTSYTVTVEEVGATTPGSVNVFAQVQGNVPSETDYVAVDKSKNTMHFIHLEAPNPQLRTLIIGVTGAVQGQRNVQFKIAAFVFPAQ